MWGGPQPSLCEEPEAPSPRVSPLPTLGGTLAVDGLHTGALGSKGCWWAQGHQVTGWGRCDVKVSQTAFGTMSQWQPPQKAGSRAREPRAVLGPSPDQAAQRASVRACCHRVEARPGRPGS